ncbi:hypothetical protein [Halorussus caseinilyticus]|uniref:Twin-arginine translocation signal domain-containing protein n=1 Tax=Halorussus caseinilyticus TaxID=3034025 RepID=A0ABD5WRM0_9EURY|nr:hypothetical protein [Halorussus sp. DT72]
MTSNGDGRSESSSINRRNVLRGAAAASLTGIGLFGSSGGAVAKTEPLADERARQVFESDASELLGTLSDEGVLADASADALPTAPNARNAADVGVARAYNDEGKEVYVARETTDRGKLTVLVKAETGESLGVLSTPDGIETYDSEGSVDPQQVGCICSDTSCVGAPGVINFCYGIPSGCC